jgi:hypothetical protein
MAQAIEIVPTGPGNTLVIPTPQDRLIEPYQTPFLFGDFSGCLGGVSIDFSCNCVFHDANTHLMFTVASCGAGAGGCVTGNIDLIGGCAAVERCQARVDAMAGVRLDATEYIFDGFPTGILNPFPAWLLGQLSPEQIALGYIPDWWAVFCDPLVITIPGFTLKPKPPLDPPVPRGAEPLAGVFRSLFPIPGEFKQQRLKPTATPLRSTSTKADSHAAPSIFSGPPLPMMKAGPIHPTDCGCDEDRATADEIDYEMVDA